ncbi:TetR/AcrR family transcriptional regulator [Nocardia sp. XZ_19_231]|uniref:TetR/AcrR family transcriptional regulator n=1 Tax=Nocardia sp. XZ_19_231 TaxID=2769252 RepID=UPI00188FFB0E|nr:TetR/AcrR family transcriptional regulator [Nocardia sp. XZ_19_231]
MTRRQPGEFHDWQFDDPRLQDFSPELWADAYSEVARNLLSSATRCFAAKGFQGTTTRDISAGAGLSPAALYVHFPTKEHMLFEITRVAHDKAHEALLIPDPGDPVEHLRSVVAEHVTCNARHHVAARVAQYEMANLTADHLAEIRAIRRRTTTLYRNLVSHGIDRGAFIPIDVTRVVRGIIALAIDPVRWYRLSGPDTPEELGTFNAGLAVALVTGGNQPDQGSGRRTNVSTS